MQAKKIQKKLLKIEYFQIHKKYTKSRFKSLLNKNLTKKFDISEYYDLPTKYEKTVVKILAQTPNTLFVYWDISQSDRDMLIRKLWSLFF